MMDKYQKYVADDRFAVVCGIELVDCKPGYAKTRVEIQEQHLNGAGVVHGGLIYTLADFCFAASANAYGNLALSIHGTISYFSKRTSGILVAEAKELSKSRKLITSDVRIFDESEELVASFKGTAYITMQTIEAE